MNGHDQLPHDPVTPGHGSNAFVSYWRKVGGGSLVLSLLIHAGLLVLASMLILSAVDLRPPIDFLSGGGSKAGREASDAVAHQVKQNRRKQMNKSTPLQKIAVRNPTSAIVLPDIEMQTFDLAVASIPLGGMMGSSGFGKTGAGGGFGSGIGTGGMRGATFKPVIMFGRELKDARKIAVVMDVSRSMTRYLPAVAQELDKIANQSVLVLYFGCGLALPKGKEKIEDKVMKTAGDEFACFWQHWQGKTPLKLPAEERKKLAYDPSLTMPLEDIYKKMSGRRNTFFVEFNGIQYAWTALMSKEVMEADTIYWFSDFMDKVDDEKMEEVRRKLKARKQKLVMHASTHGRSFDRVRDGLCLPLGGEVVEAQVSQ